MLFRLPCMRKIEVESTWEGCMDLELIYPQSSCQMAFFYSSVFCGMDDVLWLILVLRDVSAGISRVPLWHPWAEFFKGKKKMAAKYFKVKYDFSTNEARNKCNTSFLCDFDWAIHFLYYFDDSRSSSRSKRQFQGQRSKKTTISRSKKQK